jgi:hypothetical protein
MASLASIELANARDREDREKGDREEIAQEAQDVDAIDHIEDAKAFLRANLEDGELRPDSPAWRDSLFTLGELLYEQVAEVDLMTADLPKDERLAVYRDNEARMRETLRSLDEAVQRYWPGRRAAAAAYLLARTHATAARWAAFEADDPDMLDAARRTSRQRSEAELEMALAGFIKLRRLYEDQEEEHRLSETDDVMLRNCFFYEADTLFEMNRLDEAATAYRAISLRYMNEPPALEAILGQAACVRADGREREADLLIKQAEIVLSKIPPDWNERFEATTRFDRAGWERYLSWMGGQVGKPELPGLATRSG